MKLLIIGASSYVGARLYFDLRTEFNVVGTYSSNKLSTHFIHLDITDSLEVARLVRSQNPDVIVHLANNANSRWCEANPEKAVELNQISTTYVVKAAYENRAKLIYVSTIAAIDARDIYGRTKAESEIIVKQVTDGYLILRPSLILGYSPNTTNDRPFNRLLRNLDLGEEAIYDTSWKFQPTYLGHLSDVVKACIKKRIWGQTFAIVTEKMTSRYDTACDILDPFGINVTAKDDKSMLVSPVIDYKRELSVYSLPICTYQELVQRCVDEIRNRKLFLLE